MMSIQKLLGHQTPLAYQEAAKEVLACYDLNTHGTAYLAVMTAVAYGIILGKRMERAKRRQKGSTP